MESKRGKREQAGSSPPSSLPPSARQGLRVRVTVRHRLAFWKSSAFLLRLGTPSFYLLWLPQGSLFLSFAELQGERGCLCSQRPSRRLQSGPLSGRAIATPQSGSQHV